MTAAGLDALTPLQRLIVERALALSQELEATADSAPAGRVIDRCKSLLLGNGREFLRRALEDTLQARVDALEKKVSFRQACKICPPRAGPGRRPMGVRVANGTARGGYGSLSG